MIVEAVANPCAAESAMHIGLSFPQVALLAHHARLYIGNDTGLTHLAAAAGARTAMILGPSDPKRYAPFVPDALAVVETCPGGSGGRQCRDAARSGTGRAMASAWMRPKRRSWPM